VVDYLGDTNILLRRIQRAHPDHLIARKAINTLQQRGDRVCLVPQNLIELWVVCTRPVASNGFGLLPEQADRIVLRLESLFPLLKDTGGIYDEWRRLVVTYAVSGKNVHDTRLVAAMNVHGVKSILTFNTKDFLRYREIQVVSPAEVAGGRD